MKKIYRVIYVTRPTEEHSLGVVKDAMIRESSEKMAAAEFNKTHDDVDHIAAIETMD